MKILLTLLCIILLSSTTYANNSSKEEENKYEKTKVNGLSSGEFTDNIIDINVNGMVCDFCAQSIEKVFMKIDEVKGIKINLENQKVVIYLEEKTNIEDDIISALLKDAGYTVEQINRTS